MSSTALDRPVPFRLRRRRPERPDRADTSRHLLETAGEIFADKGLDAATGLEICRRAGVNAAAINYHFGGMEGLYEAVLIEARGRVPSFERLSGVAAANPDPRARLRAIIALAVGVLTGPMTQSWVLRLMLREIVSPSPAFERLILAAEALPKLRLLRTMVAQIMDLPEDHPAVAHGCLGVLAPIQLMLIGDRAVLGRVFPELSLGPAGAPVLAQRLAAFALGGLAAIAQAETGDPA